MARRKNLSPLNRAVALALAFVWLGLGVVGVVFSLVQRRLLIAVLSSLAIGYAVLWFRVFARSRLLTWREIAAPWRVD
jgi:hypothetical protein